MQLNTDQISLLSIKDVMKLTGSSRSTIYNWINQGRFPKPVSTGPNTVRFRYKDIESWSKNPMEWNKNTGMKS